MHTIESLFIINTQNKMLGPYNPLVPSFLFDIYDVISSDRMGKTIATAVLSGAGKSIQYIASTALQLLRDQLPGIGRWLLTHQKIIMEMVLIPIVLKVVSNLNETDAGECDMPSEYTPTGMVQVELNEDIPDSNVNHGAMFLAMLQERAGIKNKFMLYRRRSETYTGLIYAFWTPMNINAEIPNIVDHTLDDLLPVSFEGAVANGFNFGWSSAPDMISWISASSPSIANALKNKYEVTIVTVEDEMLNSALERLIEAGYVDILALNPNKIPVFRANEISNMLKYGLGDKTKPIGTASGRRPCNTKHYIERVAEREYENLYRKYAAATVPIRPKGTASVFSDIGHAFSSLGKDVAHVATNVAGDVAHAAKSVAGDVASAAKKVVGVGKTIGHGIANEAVNIEHKVAPIFAKAKQTFAPIAQDFAHDITHPLQTLRGAGRDIKHIITHPEQTAKSVYDLGKKVAAGTERAAKYVAKTAASDAIDLYNVASKNTQTGNKWRNKLGIVGQIAGNIGQNVYNAALDRNTRAGQFGSELAADLGGGSLAQDIGTAFGNVGEFVTVNELQGAALDKAYDAAGGLLGTEELGGRFEDMGNQFRYDDDVQRGNMYTAPGYTAPEWGADDAAQQARGTSGGRFRPRGRAGILGSIAGLALGPLGGMALTAGEHALKYFTGKDIDDYAKEGVEYIGKKISGESKGKVKKMSSKRNTSKRSVKPKPKAKPKQSKRKPKK